MTGTQIGNDFNHNINDNFSMNTMPTEGIDNILPIKYTSDLFFRYGPFLTT